MIEVIAKPTCWTRHGGRQHLNFKTKRAQKRREQAIQFVTEAAATSLHHLLKQRSVVKYDRFLGMDAEILKRNRTQVRIMQVAQGFRGRFEWALAANPV